MQTEEEWGEEISGGANIVDALVNNVYLIWRTTTPAGVKYTKPNPNVMSLLTTQCTYVNMSTKYYILSRFLFNII